ncbi:Uncharacterised protein [Segatella copri]|nr:Uncharacterised protein [Segatella copri]
MTCNINVFCCVFAVYHEVVEVVEFLLILQILQHGSLVVFCFKHFNTTASLLVWIFLVLFVGVVGHV